jgi:hypothetical protein
VSRITILKSIQRTLRALRERSESTGSGWEATVRRAIKELENLNRSTEHDFLAVGQKLMEFRSLARQIRSGTAAVTELISGDQGRNASQALSTMLEHSREMDARVERSGQALEQMRDLSRCNRTAFAGLPHTVAVFRTLCTLTRIETARLGGTGTDLGHLTAEVGPLSESIQAAGEGVLEASSGLDQDVQSALRSGADLQATQLKELPALIAGVTAGLKSFEDRRKLALESSDRQAVQYAAVSQAIDDLVGSIQFHDITRQQIEHVIEALRQLCSKGDGASLDSPGCDAGSVLTLQCMQLSEAARIFATSIERMEHDLDGIAGRSEVRPEAGRALPGMADGGISVDGQGSFFLKMEGEFSAILSMLGSCAAAQGEMESTAFSLEEMIGQMRSSIAEIRATEIRIQRISTNASVQATHLGAPGVALNVIAEVMQRLALDSNRTTEEVAATLDAMSDAASRVSGRSPDPASGALSITSHVIAEMRRAVEELHASSESSFGRVNQIMELGARLAGDIGAVRSGFSAGAMFAATVQRVRGELEEIGSRLSKTSLRAAPAQALQHYGGNYTMQAERDVHQAVATGSALPPVPAEVSKNASTDGELGDNIELF